MEGFQQFVWSSSIVPDDQRATVAEAWTGKVVRSMSAADRKRREKHALIRQIRAENQKLMDEKTEPLSARLPRLEEKFPQSVLRAHGLTSIERYVTKSERELFGFTEKNR